MLPVTAAVKMCETRSAGSNQTADRKLFTLSSACEAVVNYRDMKEKLSSFHSEKQSGQALCQHFDEVFVSLIVLTVLRHFVRHFLHPYFTSRTVRHFFP